MGRPSKGLRVQMSLRLPMDLAKYVDTLARRNGLSRNDMIVAIVAEKKERR